MKLNLTSPLRFLNDKDYLRRLAAKEHFARIIAEQNKNKDISESNKKVLSEFLKLNTLPINLIDFIQDLKGYKNIVLSEKTYNNLSNYKVPTNIRYDVLRTLPNKKYNIQVNKTLAFRYLKTDTYIYVMVYEDNKSDINRETFYFYIDLINNSFITSPRINSLTKEVYCLSESDLLKTYYDKIIVTLTYIELTDVTFDICYSNTKRGDILKGNDLKNELPFNVIQVNTNWNITKLHIGDSFQVKGHWRLQPCGVGRTKFKYTFIDTYEKTGIIKRKAGKEIN